jgi:S-formylglutathione hydrolase
MRRKPVRRPGRFLVDMLVLLICLLAASPLTAQPPAGTVREIEVPAPSLAGNLLGTPTVQAAAVYLPPGYATSPARQYPVIYLLHGIFDTHRTWLGFAGLPAILDRLIASHRLPEVIVVMPDGGNVYGGGYYRNSAVSGNWQDFLAHDLIGFVDRHYRTIAGAEGRAAVGWSMGGYGALHLAMERPGTVSVVYAISPCCLAPIEDIGFGNDVWRRVIALRGPADLEAARARSDFYVVAGIGLLAAFDPAPGAAPFHVRFPFGFVRGELVPDRAAIDRFTARFALNRLESGAGGLRALRALGLDYGINDHFAHIPPSTAAFSHRLAQLSVPHRLDIYVGNHRDRIAERLESTVLPYVGAALDRPPERGQPQ